jgi:cysteine desulfurase
LQESADFARFVAAKAGGTAYKVRVPTIYLDYNATTPLDKAVLGGMRPYLEEVYGNPSSVHHVGRRARAVLDQSRERLAALLRCKASEIVFTSGGTESNNLAVLGAARRLKERGRHLITSAIEHHAVLHCFDYLEQHEGFQVTRIPPDRDGLIDPEALRNTLRPDTTLVSIMAANNETGTIQYVSEIGMLCHERGVCFHTDAVQWFGKVPTESAAVFQADLVSLCAHKFHGPKGSGALYIRSPLQPHSILLGGSHEQERRAGTENLPAIVGLVEAAERFIKPPVFPEARLTELRNRLRDALTRMDGVVVRGAKDRGLTNTVAVTVEGCDSIGLLAGLDLEGICASSGSACSSGALTPSHVMLAQGLPKSLASGFLRFSLGRETTAEEISEVSRVFPSVVQRLRGS